MGKRLAGFLARWSPALVIMAAIFVASATPGEELPDAGRFDMVLKKGGHLLGYALLGAAYVRGLAWRGAPARRDVGTAILMVLVYAASDEIHQRFTPGRRPAVSDVLLDGAGGAAGVAAWARRHRRRIGRPD